MNESERSAMRLTATAVLSLVLGLGAVAPAGAAAGACPNEAIRAQQGSTHLPNCRAFELVTPVDKGPAGSVVFGLAQEGFPRASEQGGSFLWPLQNGMPGTTAGGWLRMKATRAAGGWLSEQVSAPSLVPPPEVGLFAHPSQVLHASPDLDCAVVQSFQPLTADIPPRSRELGVQNLFRWNGADGSYELITNRLPLNPTQPLQHEAFYRQIFSSPDCSHIYFRSEYELIAGASGYYEWHDGVLSDATTLPDGSVGAKMNVSLNNHLSGRAPSVPGGEVDKSGTASWNAVSADGTHFFFTAITSKTQSVSFSSFVEGDTFTLGNLPGVCDSSTTAGVEYRNNSLAFRTAIDAALEAACTGSAGDDFAVIGDPPAAKVTFQGQFVGTSGVPLLGCAKVSGVGSCGVAKRTPAVFMREIQGDGSASVTEISESKTAVPTNGARFEAASPDGSTVLFRANYGIAPTTSGGPTATKCGPISPDETIIVTFLPIEAKHCDLYAYDTETGVLTDVSAHAGHPDGAQIQGTVAVDEDGSHVYFAALGQLVPGEGSTYEQNVADQSVNVYLSADGELSYVATLEGGGGVPDDLTNGVLMRRPTEAKARTSTDGDRLLFASTSNLTGYESSGGQVAYMWSADTGTVSCVSCPPDGSPTQVPPNGGGGQDAFLARGDLRVRSLSEDGSRVFFASPDVLAPGAVAGKRNVYQWEEGQVSFLAIGERLGAGGILPELAGYLDADADGDSVFIATNEQLVPQDRDFIGDVYAVRVNGGFLFEAPPPACQVDESIALVPNQIYCQGDPSAQPGSLDPSSSSAIGAGNVRNCARRARRAQRLSKRAKVLRRRARRAARVSNHSAARRNAKRARRFAKVARRNSKAAKRCRRRARAVNSNRGGAR